MPTEPVGIRLDERRPAARAGPVDGGAGDRVHRHHVVAVDENPGHAETLGPAVQRHAGLPGHRRGDRPLVVLAEEHQGQVVHRRPRQRLAGVTFAGRAVPEVDDHSLVVGDPLRPSPPFHPDAQGITDRVQGLGREHQRVRAEPVGVRVPAAEVGPAEQAEQLGRGDAAGQRHSVLTVTGENLVMVTQRVHRADLCGLLPG